MSISLEDVLREYPHLASPAALGRAVKGEKFRLPAHLAALNRELMEVAAVPASRKIVNIPYQHGKSWISSIFFPAWVLLLWPQTRVVLVGYGTDFATEFGSQVRDVVEAFGRPLGVRLKEDTKAKGLWGVEGHDGGMTCVGPGGGVIGRPADLFIIDDLIKNAQEAVSPTITERNWDFYKSAVYSRLRRDTSIVIVATRWTKNDICGKILSMASRTGEKWQVVKYKSIAGPDDPLGRKPGEALWPEQVPLEHLLNAKKEFGRFFNAAWQQEPEDEDGTWFHPRPVAQKHEGWPHYHDAHDSYVLESSPRQVIPKGEVTVLCLVDWAFSKKKSADHTAVGVFGLTTRGDLLVLEVVNVRVSPRELAPLLERVCQSHGVHVCGVEQGHPTLADEVGQYKIPPVRWISTRSRGKLPRALSAIFMGENDRVYLPGPPQRPEWLEVFTSQLVAFTGLDDEEDDMVDCCPAGTMVRVKDGVKSIEAIRVGDMVLTHKGRYRRVTSVWSRVARSLYEVQAVGRPANLVTANHKMYCRRSYQPGPDKRHSPGKGRREWRASEWLSVAGGLAPYNYGTCSVWETATEDRSEVDLLPCTSGYRDDGGTLVAVTHGGSRDNPNGRRVPRFLRVDEDFCLLLGYYVAEGSCTRHQFALASSVEEKGMHEFVASWAGSFGLHVCVQVKGGARSDYIACKPMRDFFSPLGRGPSKALPAWVMRLPPEKQKRVLIGYLVGDGHYARKSVVVNTVSPALAFQAFELGMRLGLAGTMRKTPKAAGLPQWTVVWSRLSAEKIVSWTPPGLLVGKKVRWEGVTGAVDQTNVRLLEDTLVGRVKSVREVVGDVEVYNMAVDEDESYTANGTVVHNCLSMACDLATQMRGRPRAGGAVPLLLTDGRGGW